MANSAHIKLVPSCPAKYLFGKISFAAHFEDSLLRDRDREINQWEKLRNSPAVFEPMSSSFCDKFKFCGSRSSNSWPNKSSKWPTRQGRLANLNVLSWQSYIIFVYEFAMIRTAREVSSSKPAANLCFLRAC